MRPRHAGNNWFPLLGLTLLFLAAGALTTMSNNGYGSVPRFFVAATVIWAAVSAIWLWLNPSEWPAPARHYLYLVGALIGGVLLTSILPFLRGCGPWMVIGGALIAYGRFEKIRLIVTTGAITAVSGFLAAVVTADVWGGAMHLLTTAALAFAANRLYLMKHGRRRESQDADPSFIGSFEEFDPEDQRLL